MGNDQTSAIDPVYVRFQSHIVDRCGSISPTPSKMSIRLHAIQRPLTVRPSIIWLILEVGGTLASINGERALGGAARR